MPGIVGLITRRPPETAAAELRQMVAAMGHEPFYRSGTWADARLGVYAGWVAREGSFADPMPVHNEAGDVALVFSGEEFPDAGTVALLRKKGHRLEAERPSYLVHLYEDDPGFPAALNGRFHGLLADRRLGSVTLFNDRYGMHRLYYHEAPDAFYFAAEAKAILAVRPELRRVDPRCLGEFIALGCVLGDRALFPGIRLLPAAAAWLFEDAAIQGRRRYFDPREWEEQGPLSPERYTEEVRDVLTRSLPRYFGGGERVGMSLTGGLDTRLIMAWTRPAPGALPCYTFGGALRESEDVLIARQVAGICGQPHSVIPIGADFLSRFSHYAERSVYLTDGCVDLSRSPDLYVSERARRIAPVKVVGTYGSEMLTEIPSFKPAQSARGLFAPEILGHLRQAEAGYDALRGEHPVTFAAFRQSPWWHHGVLALEQTQLAVRAPYLDNEFVRTVFRAPRTSPAAGDVRLQLIREGHPALGRLRTDRGVGARSGAARRLLELSFRAEHAWDYAMPQWLARIDGVLAPLRPERAFLGRHKTAHFRLWYRDALSGYVRELLLDPRALARPYLERAGLEAVVQSHLGGRRNYTTEIHKLLALELLHRLFIDSR